MKTLTETQVTPFDRGGASATRWPDDHVGPEYLFDPSDTSAEAAPATGLPSASQVLRRIGASVPRAWGPAAFRGLAGAAAHMPAGLRHRVRRFLVVLHPDMGDIESDYPAWIEAYDTIDADRRRSITAEIAGMAEIPVISLLMPVFDPSPDHLLGAIHSVQDQLYPGWELCIGDDASTDPAVMEILRAAAARDHRVKLVRRERNGHISAASNSALAVATGRFVALLDHDDILPPHALFEVAKTILARPNLDVIYSDEDHIDEMGHRSHPYFKPDFSQDLMLGQNLISHLGIYRRTLVDAIGGFRTGFEGSQDYDLALRMVAATEPGRIAHIPMVLYHWRQGAADRTFSEAAHDRCVDSGRRAVRDFVASMADGARVEPTPNLPAWSRVVYQVPEPEPVVSVIVTGHGPADSRPACVDGLLNGTDYAALEVLVQADAGDTRLRAVEAGAGPNQVAEVARGGLLLFLDANLVPNQSGWLREMVSQAVRPGVGAVGAKLLDGDGTVRQAGLAIGGRGVTFTPFAGQQAGRAGYFGHSHLVRDVSAVGLQCMMLSRDAFLGIGGVDEVLWQTAFGDVDLCLKLRRSGRRIVWTPHAELTFRDGAARHAIPADRLKRAAVRMRQVWGQELDADPFWSPNLSRSSGGVTLAFPPRGWKAGGRA